VSLYEILAMLRSERDRVERTIQALERLEQRHEVAKSHRGRKSMGAAERAAVSERMRLYWEAWRQRKRGDVK
jgi:hypothetical protein